MFFKSIDFLSPQISLYYDNRKRHSSIIGGFLTLILFLYTLILISSYSYFNLNFLQIHNYGFNI